MEKKLCCLLNGKYQCTICLIVLCSEEFGPEKWDESEGTCNHTSLRDYPSTGMTYSRTRPEPFGTKTLLRIESDESMRVLDEKRTNG